MNVLMWLRLHNHFSLKNKQTDTQEISSKNTLIHGKIVAKKRCEEVLANFSSLRWFEDTGGGGNRVVYFSAIFLREH